MKAKYLGAMLLGVLLIAGCSDEEEDNAIKYFTGMDPDWFRSAPAPTTLDNAQELETNVFNAQTDTTTINSKITSVLSIIFFTLLIVLNVINLPC